MNTFMNDIWSFYYHDIFDNDWTYKSYIKLLDISCTNDFWMLNSIIQDKFTKGLYFLMREHIFPCWDDKENVKGGCFTMKVLKKDSFEFWEKMSISVLGETIAKNKDMWDIVNGISISPKKYFCIVKIWVKNDKIKVADLNIPDGIHGEILYKSNFELMSNQE